MTTKDLTTLSPTELGGMAKADIIAEILEGVTQTDSTVVQDPKLGNISMEETTTDAYGNVLGTRMVDWTYYPTGEVNEIIVKDNRERLVIRHFRDGRQPMAIRTAIPERPKVAPPEVRPVPAEKKPWYRRLWHTLWPPVSDEQED